MIMRIICVILLSFKKIYNTSQKKGKKFMKVEFIISYLLIIINLKIRERIIKILIISLNLKIILIIINLYLYNWNSISLFNHGIFDCCRLDVYIILS